MQILPTLSPSTGLTIAPLVEDGNIEIGAALTTGTIDIGNGTQTGTVTVHGTAGLAVVGAATVSGGLVTDSVEAFVDTSDVDLYTNTNSGDVNIATYATRTGTTTIGSSTQTGSVTVRTAGITSVQGGAGVFLIGAVDMNDTLDVAGTLDVTGDSTFESVVRCNDIRPENDTDVLKICKTPVQGGIEIGHGFMSGDVKLQTQGTLRLHGTTLVDITSNVDMSGTLDVTNNATFNAILKNKDIRPNDNADTVEICKTSTSGGVAIGHSGMSGNIDISTNQTMTLRGNAGVQFYGPVDFAGKIDVTNAVTATGGVKTSTVGTVDPTTSSTLFPDQTSGTLNIAGKSTRTGVIEIGHASSPAPINLKTANAIQMEAATEVRVFGGGGLRVDDDTTLVGEVKLNTIDIFNTFADMSIGASLGSNDMQIADAATTGTVSLKGLTIEPKQFSMTGDMRSGGSSMGTQSVTTTAVQFGNVLMINAVMTFTDPGSGGIRIEYPGFTFTIDSILTLENHTAFPYTSSTDRSFARPQGVGDTIELWRVPSATGIPEVTNIGDLIAGSLTFTMTGLLYV